jgi:hypothetical protein
MQPNDACDDSILVNCPFQPLSSIITLRLLTYRGWPSAKIQSQDQIGILGLDLTGSDQALRTRQGVSQSWLGRGLMISAIVISNLNPTEDLTV